jgi:hypothetical protein
MSTILPKILCAIPSGLYGPSRQRTFKGVSSPITNLNALHHGGPVCDVRHGLLPLEKDNAHHSLSGARVVTAYEDVLASAAKELRDKAVSHGQDPEVVQRYIDLYQVRFAQLIEEFRALIEGQGKQFVLHEAVRFLNSVFLEMIVRDTEWMAENPESRGKLH